MKTLKHCAFSSCLLLLILTQTKTKAQWTLLNTASNHNYTYAFFVNDSIGYASGSYTANDGSIMKTINGGLTWMDVTPNAKITYQDIYFITKDTGFALSATATGDPVYYKTTNGGISWENKSTPSNLPTSGGTDIEFVDDSIGFICTGTYNSLYKTIDGGESYTPILSTINTYRTYFINSTVGFYWGFTSGGLKKTTDQGNTWTTIGNMTTPTDVYFVNEMEGMAIDYYGNLYKTIDQGESWQFYSTIDNGIVLTMGCVFENDQVGYISTLLGSVYKTIDGGTSWQIEAQISNLYYKGRFFSSPNSSIYLASDSLIYKKEANNTAKINLISDQEKSSLHIYPNPATSYLRINYIGTESLQSIRLYSLTGEIVYEKNLSILNNANCISIDFLNKGTYLLKATTEREIISKKLIIQSY